jgi:hypothetical protein
VSPNERSPDAFPYRKLHGDFRGFFRRDTLWLGPDHLLCVASSRFSETYQRFYLPDIQTVIIRKTPRFVVPYYWSLLALAALILLLSSLDPFKAVLFWPAVGILGVVALYLYIVSMFQSCTCHLITRVSRVELRSLFRLRSARKFVDEIAQQIIGIQGQMPEGWVERTTSLSELSTAADRNPETVVDLRPAGGFSWLTVIVFVLVLLDAGFTWLQLIDPVSRWLSFPGAANMTALAVCGTVAVVRLSRQKGGTTLRRLVLGGLFVVAGVTYGSIIVQSFDQQFFRMTYVSVYLSPHIRPLAIAGVILDFAVAIPGLVLAVRQSRRPRTSTSLFGTGAPPS